MSYILDKLREQFPMYKDIPDGDLAYRLWDKSYKGKLAMGEYADKLELDNDAFQNMIKAARSGGYEPTSATYAENAEAKYPKLGPFLQGQTLGFADEIIGGMATPIRRLRGDDRPMEEIAQEVTGDLRADLGMAREASPVGAGAMEVAGAIASPANLIGAPSAIARGPAWARAAVTGAAQGAAYGAGTAEGNLGKRAENAVEVAIPSGIFGAMGQQVFRLAGAAGKKVYDAMKGAGGRPTVEALRNVKNAAYDAVDQSGLKFSRTAINRLYQGAQQAANDVNYVPEVDRQTYAALKMMEEQLGKNLTIGQLDKLRQGLYKRLEASGGSEIAIDTMIDNIDQMIDSVPMTNDLMRAARLANSRYKKSQLLENAFKKAEDQTAATGSGGNILNKYRQAVSSIINNPKQAKWFTDVEREQMEKFVRGTWDENMLRRIGKLSPSGNGLMLALNVGAIATEPMLGTITAAGVASKAASDYASKTGAERLQGLIATGILPTQVPYLPGMAPAAASTAAQLGER